MNGTTLDSSVLEKTAEDVYTCASCGYCRANCAVAAELGFERLSAASGCGE